MIDHIEATYSDIKTVKSRGVCQIVLEMPIEGMTRAFDLLGAPVPGNEVWVVLARLREPVAAIASEAEQQPEPEAHHIDGPANDDDPHKPIRPLSQISAYLCTIVAFRRFLWEEFNLDSMPTADQAADFVRSHCGVQSRREFDLIESAAANFRHLRWKYNAWLQVPA